jgi:tetratricopeptide (TPR) repeat protein
MEDKEKMSAEEYYKLGNEYFDKSKYDDAIAAYSKAIELKLIHADVFNNRGRLYFLKEEYDKAIEDFSNAAKLDPYSTAYYNRGVVYGIKGEYDKAIEDYNRELKFTNLSDAFNNRGNVYAYKKEYDKAIEDYNKAIESKPNNVNALFNRGIAYAYKGEYDKAIDDYDKTIELKPNYAAVFNNRGNAYAYKKEYDKAIEDYNKAIELEPNEADAFNNRGTAYFNKREYNKAIEDYDKAIELKPDHALAFNNRKNTYIQKSIAEIQKIEASFNNKAEYNESVDNFIKLFNSSPKYDTYNTMIASLIKIENIDDIIKQLITSKALSKYTPYANSFDDANSSEISNEIYQEIFLRASIVVAYLQVDKEELTNGVSHYTQKAVAEKLLFEKKTEEKKPHTKLWFGSIDGVNDPEEGNVLGTYLGLKKESEETFFAQEVFFGCFTFNQDDLNQFRLYGNTNGEEASGVNLVFTSDFFDTDIKTQLIMMDDTEKSIKEEPNYPLYHCLYADPETGRILQLSRKDDYVLYRERKEDEDVKAYNQQIEKKLSNIKEELAKIKDLIGRENLDHSILYGLLTTLRYLVKHIDYRTEQECRVILLGVNKEDIITDDTNSTNVKRYIQTRDIRPYIRKVCFGSQAGGLKIFRRRLMEDDALKEISCSRSTSRHRGNRVD